MDSNSAIGALTAAVETLAAQPLDGVGVDALGVAEDVADGPEPPPALGTFESGHALSV